MRARLLGEEPAAAAAVLSVLFPHSWPDVPVRASARARCTLPLDGHMRVCYLLPPLHAKHVNGRYMPPCSRGCEAQNVGRDARWVRTAGRERPLDHLH